MPCVHWGQHESIQTAFSKLAALPSMHCMGNCRVQCLRLLLLSSAAMLSIESKGNYSISVAVSGTTWFMHLSLRKHVLL